MKSVILKGQKIEIGSKVRFINDKELYVGLEGVTRPIIGQVYTVRGFTDVGGFFLEEIKNDIFQWMIDDKVDSESEPGFATWRFEPAEMTSKRKIVQIKIEPIIEERLDTNYHVNFTPSSKNSLKVKQI